MLLDIYTVFEISLQHNSIIQMIVERMSWSTMMLQEEICLAIKYVDDDSDDDDNIEKTDESNNSWWCQKLELVLEVRNTSNCMRNTSQTKYFFLAL